MVQLTSVIGFLSLGSQCLALQRLPLAARQSVANDGVLEVVQAAAPPRETFDGFTCKQTIFEHDFANSYGSPYIGVYSPPADCNFTTTLFNISVVSKGRQYDRLAQLFFGDIEIWRTSTAMPTESGIHCSFQKDMTIFDTLLRENQKVIFDLGNVYDGVLYTGIFNVTLEALYYDDVYTEGLNPAELIYPISALTAAQNTTPVFSLPDDSGSVNLTLPRNIKTAVVSLMASGNGAEEFWYTNVPSEYTNSFPSNPGWLYGYSPFREVQLLIDGQLAGVSWPFPILFTGGVDPGLWRPIVGIDTFDLPSFEVDVTPWLSLLCDGEEHVFQIQVVGYDSSVEGGIGPVGQNWWITGTVFVWLDETIEQTVAGEITVDVSAPVFDFDPRLGTVTGGNGTVSNSSLWFSLAAQRTLSISSTTTTRNETKVVSWTQDLSFSNVQNMTDPAFNQSLEMASSGSFSGSASGVVSTYEYPLNLYSAYVIAETDDELSSVFCMIDRSLIKTGLATIRYLTGSSTGSESLATRQNVTSNYYWNATIVEGVESMDTCDGETWYSFSGEPGSADGIPVFSTYLSQMDDAMVEEEALLVTIEVPATAALPLVYGEPII